MSAGRFVRSFYELDNGEVVACRVQPETIAGFNTPAAGPPTQEGSANLSGARRRNGINARYISGRWAGETPPAGYDPRGVIRIPILDPAVYNGLTNGQQVTYLGTPLEIIGKTGEKIR